MMRVLLADERSSLRSALQLLVEQKTKAQVVGEAEDSACLLHLTQCLSPDLILLDGQLPGLSAPDDYQQFVALLRTILPQVYIIVLISRPEEISRYTLTGADAVVSKAEAPDCLQAALLQAEQIISAYHRPATE